LAFVVPNQNFTVHSSSHLRFVDFHFDRFNFLLSVTDESSCEISMCSFEEQRRRNPRTKELERFKKRMCHDGPKTSAANCELWSLLSVLGLHQARSRQFPVHRWQTPRILHHYHQKSMDIVPGTVRRSSWNHLFPSRILYDFYAETVSSDPKLNQ
jgi:hypothetical protein